MRILFVLEYYPPHIGGVESLFETIARGLVERGHEVTVLTMRLSGYAKREKRDGVRIERIAIPFDSRALFALWTIPRAIAIARHTHIIHTSWLTPIPAASIAGLLTRTPVIVTGHEFIGKRWFSIPRVSKLKASALMITEHVLYRFPAALIAAVSDATRRDLISAGIKPSRIMRIPNAFDQAPWTAPDLAQRTHALEEAYGLADRTVVVIYGRPGVTKGLEYAIEAFDKMRAYLPNATLLLIVSTRPHDGYRAIMRVLERIGRDQVIEKNDLPYPELIAHVNLADIVLIPSLTEGFGYTTLESATLGKRIVASNIGAIPEVISGRYRLVDPKDPEALSHAAVAIIKKPPEPVPYKSFPASATIEAYEHAYERIIKRA